MKRLFLASMLALAALAAPSAPAAPAKKAAATRDWTKTVVATPAGGFRMGNPAARVKLVEYGSLTCSHCADFSRTGTAPLTALVKSGKVSFEFRNFVLNGPDLAASLVARCGGPAKFFPVLGKMYASQDQWTGKISSMSEAEAERLKTLSRAQQLARVADLGGLTTLAAGSGISPQQAKKCLSDEAAVQRLADMYEAAAKLGVDGTPSFSINGALVHAHDWAELAPLIRKAGG
ncbi:MAG TPA: thioredoxin domain-containing protein [Allosphingosinicella sp.]|jgi:protein-disulfide isomerase